MKTLGYILITVSFLFGAFLTVQHPTLVEAAPFIGALLIGAVGITLARLAIKKAATSESALATGLDNVRLSLRELAEKTAQFELDKESIDTYELRHHIDRNFRDDIEVFVQARESIAHTYGLQAYANVMSHFASAERYMNRVWSASTDGYIDEAHTYIGRSAEQFREAHDRFEGLKG